MWYRSRRQSKNDDDDRGVMHLGRLEGTQAARVSQGCTGASSSCGLRALQTSCLHHINLIMNAKAEVHATGLRSLNCFLTFSNNLSITSHKLVKCDVKPVFLEAFSEKDPSDSIAPPW